MIEIFSAMSFIAETVSPTDLPLSAASEEPFSAICSIDRLFSAFLVIEALICSRLDVVSSTDAACSLVPCERDCEVALTCEEAPVSAAAPERTSPMTWESLPTMFASEFASTSRSERRSEEHTSELQSPCNLVCRLLLEKK